jgi:hypothetical protein
MRAEKKCEFATVEYQKKEQETVENYLSTGPVNYSATGRESRRILAEAMQENTRLEKLVMKMPEIALESSDSE